MAQSTYLTLPIDERINLKKLFLSQYSRVTIAYFISGQGLANLRAKAFYLQKFNKDLTKISKSIRRNEDVINKRLYIAYKKLKPTP